MTARMLPGCFGSPTCCGATEQCAACPLKVLCVGQAQTRRAKVQAKYGVEIPAPAKVRK